ncbi:MAG TPA: bifunctional 4-hydroxy-2-oxoglutarate aldolase/2-dehydro-3-deoxy-phosphogluconate aldolase, partial [Tepidisphaeraceae bacterium]|nr:bifunctional 4-hydroxy-2-oxoglutarate aldolase/2-dehydro-3-deoxy-phosphogluconate aldolase [Tepidisphaeraceae bacterium]
DRIFIGAGTIRTASDVDLAINAGAQYLISPGFDRASVERSHKLGVLHLPGVFTATEAMNAFEAGCLLLKLFPAEMFGPPYLKSLRAPLDDVKFVPTGGVTAENIGAWRRAGASAVGVASSLVSGPDQPAAQIVERARALRAGWESSANA